jgi:hypothetical protein
MGVLRGEGGALVRHGQSEAGSLTSEEEASAGNACVTGGARAMFFAPRQVKAGFWA